MNRAMVVNPDDSRLIALAWRLDRLRWIPFHVLAPAREQGRALSLGLPRPAIHPTQTGTDTADWELAASYCAGPRSCRMNAWRLELPAAGEDTVGVSAA